MSSVDRVEAAGFSPLALKTVPFHGDTLEALQTPDGKVYVSLRRCCEALGIDPDSQRRRLADKERSPWACTVMMTVHDASGRRQEACLVDLDTLPMWLATIDGSRVREEVRPKLLDYQRECARVLREHFLGKPPEDRVLAMLDAIREVRLAEIETERKVEQVKQLAVQARREAAEAGQVAQAALDQATGNYGYYSVLGYLRLRGRDVTVAEAAQHGRRLTAICRQSGVDVRSIREPRFGAVNLYPEGVLDSYFGQDEG
jgi:hypothetical protein